MTAGSPTPRTVVLGFDALDVRYLDRFSESLPNFRRLREEGVASSLESTLPPWTGSAWPSMYTGADPSHHGVFDFFRHDGYPDSGNVVSRNDVAMPALWNYLSSENVPSVVCNVPVTHPAEPIEGALVPGYLANEDEPGRPEGIRDELSEAVGEEYRIYSRAEMASDPDEKLAGYLDLIDLRRRAALALLDRQDWQLAVLQVQKTDAVFHNFEDDADFRAVYEAADAFLGDVLDAVEEPVNVIVCSDHGIGPVEGYRIHLNDVLREHGYLETTDDGEARTLQAEKQALVEGGGGSGGEASAPSGEDGDGTAADLAGAQNDDAPEAEASASGALLPRLVDGLSHVGLTPARVYGAAERVGLEDALVSITPSSVGDAVAESVDWRASTAYCEKSTRLGIRINLEGREPQGVVPESEYEDVRAELVELLSGLTTPDGEPAFETVVPSDEVYDGPYLDRAPDVFTVPKDMNHAISTALYGQAFTPVDKHDHQRNGVFLASGPAFDAGGAAAGGSAADGAAAEGTAADEAADTVASAGDGGLSLVDVAPVIMAALERPIPERMTGRAPESLLSVPVERESYGDVRYGDEERVDASEGAVTDRLEDLGYL